MKHDDNKLKKIGIILSILILITLITPIAVIFLSFFLIGLVDNDAYSSTDGSTQV